MLNKNFYYLLYLKLKINKYTVINKTNQNQVGLIYL